MKVSIKRSGYDPNGPRVNDPTLEGRTNRPRFTKRRREAAIAAIDAMLADDRANVFLIEGQPRFPGGLTVEDLEGAKEAIEALVDRWK